MDGNLECLYHGWQFNSAGTYVKNPQLEPGAKIPKTACAQSYEMQESQVVIWVCFHRRHQWTQRSFPSLNNLQGRGFRRLHPFMSSLMTTLFCLRASWTLLMSPSHT